MANRNDERNVAQPEQRYSEDRGAETSGATTEAAPPSTSEEPYFRRVPPCQTKRQCREYYQQLLQQYKAVYQLQALYYKQSS